MKREYTTDEMHQTLYQNGCSESNQWKIVPVGAGKGAMGEAEEVAALGEGIAARVAEGVAGGMGVLVS